MTSNMHILVVDDEVNIRGALITMLEKRGYLVHGASSAEEALAAWQRFAPEVLVRAVAEQYQEVLP